MAYWLHGQIIGRVVAEMDPGHVDLAQWDKVSFEAVLGMILSPEKKPTSSPFLHAGGWGTTVIGMERPVKFEHTRFLGDKRTQLVYDLDEWNEQEIVDTIVAEGVGLCFGPDTLAEARNRGYTLATAGATRRLRKPRA